MITIQWAMLVALGFFMAALLGFLLAPFYRRRAARLATEALKATMPLTAAEIAADKDRLRAQYALLTHRLERKLDEANHASARQMVEINRRDAGISALEGEVQRLRTSLEEHENARRVLEQTITERLPKVETRLAEAKKLLYVRDREISTLTHSSKRQTQALEEATQINTQQRDELHRLNATLAARAARNRETLSDPRFDGEVALRSEIEALRAKTRDQSALISRLQGALGNAGARPDQIAGAPNAGWPRNATDYDHENEIDRLRKSLSEAELALKSARGMAEAGSVGQAALESEVRSLKVANEDKSAEIAKLKAALRAYEAEDADERTLKDSKIAMRAKLSALQAEAEENSATIQRLRAEAAAANEKLARQAAHYMDEMRRMGAGTRPASGPSGRDLGEKARKQPLVDRISAPRPHSARANGGSGAGLEDPARVTGFLRALGGKDNAPQQDGAANGSSAQSANSSSAQSEQTTASPAVSPADAAPPKPERKSSLMERITRSEKPLV
ncbi:MAG: hypothetical protein WC807_05920 [Hyphomicrobium sp.]